MEDVLHVMEGMEDLYVPYGPLGPKGNTLTTVPGLDCLHVGGEGSQADTGAGPADLPDLTLLFLNITF